MLRAVPSCLLITLLALTGCDPNRPSGRRDGGPNDAAVDISDADGDTISDADEGAATNRDTDGDGTPDYLDDDSDGDGIPDAIEAGDDNPATPPVDSDFDLVPDFIDLDADGNGIPDARELRSDVDGDGIENFADVDDDNDGIQDVQELNGMLDPPYDHDGDGVPDYQDRDSDNDTIMDGHERDADTDRDGVLDVHDTDSDGDGLSDAMEAGDADITTAPVDTDMDGTPDFRDPDSDNDGLPDADEATHGTSPTSGDTDGDGVSDLIEIGAGTNPTDPSDSPRTRGDFVFTVPYMAPPDPPEDTLTFQTSIQYADVYFSFDVTGSMAEELRAMRDTTTGVPAIIDQLRCAPTGGSCTEDSDCTAGVCFAGSCITDPADGDGCIPDMHTGVGAWWELNTFLNLRSLSDDHVATAMAIPCPRSPSGPFPANLYGGTTCGSGPGGAEAPYQPPYCVADRAICGGGCATSGVGCGGFRPEAIKIYVQITDADQQCSGSGCSSYTGAGAGAALAGQNIRFISLVGNDDAGGTGTPRSVAEEIGRASNTVNAAGDPFVYDARDAAVVGETVRAVRELARGVPLRVTIDATDEPDDAGDALQFIERLVTNTTDPGCSMEDTEDADDDGVPETYPSVLPGNPVCWDVIPRMNETVMPDTVPLVFKARLTVYGDGSPLDDRLVYFLIPPRIEQPGGPD